MIFVASVGCSEQVSFRKQLQGTVTGVTELDQATYGDKIPHKWRPEVQVMQGLLVLMIHR